MATHRVAISSWALDHKIPPGSPDWRGFNASFVNRDVTAFDLARQVYDGHAFTTWHKDNWRTTANFVCGQHIGLDFDNGDQSSSLETLRSSQFIGKFASMIYTTPSHTPTAPRARVVF